MHVYNIYLNNYILFYVSCDIRLYKSLEDYDVLRGIFTNLDDTKDVTRKALEAEERGDYLTALNLYKKVYVFDLMHVFVTILILLLFLLIFSLSLSLSL